MPKPLKIIGTVIFWIIIIVFVFLLAGNFAAKYKPVYNIMPYCNYVVVSGSMQPDINPGDYIIDLKTDFSDIKIGDDITYHDTANELIVTHRVIAIDKDTVTVQGIEGNNQIPDTIKKEDYLGKKVLVIPKIGYFFEFVQKPYGMAVIIGLIVLILALDFISPNKKPNKSRNKFKDSAEDDSGTDIENDRKRNEYDLKSGYIFERDTQVPDENEDSETANEKNTDFNVSDLIE